MIPAPLAWALVFAYLLTLLGLSAANLIAATTARPPRLPEDQAVTAGTAIDLRPGDYWSWFSQGGVRITGTELTDDGRIEVAGTIEGGHDHGQAATWRIPLTGTTEYQR